MEREGNEYFSLSFHILFFPFFAMGKNGKTHIFPWAKMGLDPPPPIGNYSFKGGFTSTLKYSSMEIVRQEFYEMYPGIDEFEYNIDSGGIPLLRKTAFAKVYNDASNTSHSP